MEPGTERRVGDMSKSEILRDIITEKLCTAAREILAVVERTVSGYEEEAAGFRLEVEQQRRQMEALLQVSYIKMEATDDQQEFPVYQPPPPPPEEEEEEEEESGGGEPVEEEQQHKYELSVEADGGVSLLCFTGEYHVEEEESTGQALPTPTKDQEPITELDFDTLTGSFPPSVQSYRRSTGTQRISEELNHVDLRIRILGDAQINCLSTEVYQKYPLHELQCPRGLRETDFLRLLRSTFPQLAADFDFFTTNRSRKLHPLKVQKLTPEEIHRSIRSNGNSALYIRLKEQRTVSVRNSRQVFQEHEEPQVSAEEFHPSPGGAAASPFGHSGVQSHRRRTLIKETRNRVTLQLRILEDPETKTLSNDVYRTSPLHQLQCPLGLKESNFLRLLRSTFPQLAGDKPFDVFTYDRYRKLHPLRIKILTPEAIKRSILSCGRAFLCIRLRHHDELQSREEDLPSTADPTNLNTRVQSDRRKVGRPRKSLHDHLDFKICILEDRQLSRFSMNVYRKFPLQQLQCPRGLKKRDFLHLLRSTFPQLAGDQPFDFVKSDRRKNLLPLRVKTLTPDEIHRRICFDGRSTLFIRLKKPNQHTRQTRLSSSTSQGREDEKIKTKGNDNKSLDLWSLLVSGSERKEDKTMKEDRDWKPDTSEKNLRKRESEKTQRLRFNRSGTRRKRRRILSSPPASSTRAASLRASSSRASSSQASSSQASSSRASSSRASSSRASSSQASSPRASSSRASSSRASSPRASPSCASSSRASSSRAVTAAGEVIPSCKVCGAVRRSVSMVIKHAWSHVDDPARLCGVCGECSESAEKLRHHLQGHQKAHGCPICGKFFLSPHGLKGHIARHNGEKPYECEICHKAFTENWVLNSHMVLHGATASRLQAHTRSHSGDFSSKLKLMARVQIQTL